MIVLYCITFIHCATLFWCFHYFDF